MHKGFILLMAFGLAVFTSLIAVFLLGISTPGGSLERVAEICGGRWPGGIIQFFTYCAFWYGILEIFFIN
ncbi:MAG: hypothetical protein AAFU67_11290, partial [Bacteroidota bacterium]